MNVVQCVCGVCVVIKVQPGMEECCLCSCSVGVSSSKKKRKKLYGTDC